MLRASITPSSARKVDRPRKQISPTATKNTPNTASEGAAIAARDSSRAYDSAASINNPVAALEGGPFWLGRIAVGANRKA